MQKRHGLNCETGAARQPCLLPLSTLGTAHHLNVDDLWWHIWGPACTSVPHHYRSVSLLILVPLLNTSTDFQWGASASQFYTHSVRWDILGEHISYYYCSSMLLLCKYGGTFDNLCYLYFINEPWHSIAFFLFFFHCMRRTNMKPAPFWENLSDSIVGMLLVNLLCPSAQKWAACGQNGIIRAIYSTLQ